MNRSRDFMDKGCIFTGLWFLCWYYFDSFTSHYYYQWASIIYFGIFLTINGCPFGVLIANFRIHGRVVDIATGYGLENQCVGVLVLVASKTFRFSTSFWPVLEPTQTSIRLVTEPHSQGVKWPERDAEYSRPTSAEFKKTWIHTSTPPYVFMA
jgi:hypothetical protein